MDDDIPIVYCVAIVVSYLFGCWVGYGEGKREVMDTWREWMDKCMKKEGEK